MRKKHNNKIYICKPHLKHADAPKDFVHQIHKWTAGIVLIDHIEPDGKLASEKHKDIIILQLLKEKQYNVDKRR